MSYKIALLSLFLIFPLQITLPQGEIDDQAKIFYRNEKTLGLLINSNGYGLSGRFGKQINARNKQIFTTDISVIKHPKESKTISTVNYRSFVYGKLNTFFTVRAGYGYQHEMFRKLDKGGISIRYFYDLGPSFGFYKPVYYEVFKIDPYTSIPEYYPSKFDPSKSDISYAGKYSFFKGLSEINFDPGVYARFGFCFEYSTTDNIIHAIEAGVIADVFMLGVPIMAYNNEDFFYPALFVSYRFGKVVDARFSARKRKEMEKESETKE
ncbi:MAG: hypothetical protein JXB49_20440 [Bacteroidales bacterium]|nr:hypothetical protein [Bacteroidales bacterium]